MITPCSQHEITCNYIFFFFQVTQAGETICNFNLAPGKQPYELLILGSALKEDKINIPDGKLVISIPSAVHSHKPPVTGVKIKSIKIMLHIIFVIIC